jgi:hypothetical protein
VGSRPSAAGEVLVARLEIGQMKEVRQREEGVNRTLDKMGPEIPGCGYPDVTSRLMALDPKALVCSLSLPARVGGTHFDTYGPIREW